MNIAILGHGLEGQAVEAYFKTHSSETDPNHFTFFDHFEDHQIPDFHLENFDLVFRSPSVHPQSVLKPEEPRIGPQSPTISSNIAKRQSLALPALKAREPPVPLLQIYSVNFQSILIIFILSAILAHQPS